MKDVIATIDQVKLPGSELKKVLHGLAVNALAAQVLASAAAGGHSISRSNVRHWVRDTAGLPREPHSPKPADPPPEGEDLVQEVAAIVLKLARVPEA